MDALLKTLFFSLPEIQPVKKTLSLIFNFSDIDGVCIVPKEIEKEVIEGALEKALGEKTVQKAIENGMGAREAFDKYGIM